MATSSETSPSNAQHGNVQQPTPASSKKGMLPISSLLMSPPEQTPYESFSRFSQAPALVKFNGNPAQRPPSPPVSPWTQASNQVVKTTTGRELTDPILFPEEPMTGPVQPLFRQPLVKSEAITEHISARKAEPLPMGVRPPTQPEYRLFSDYINVQWNSVYLNLKTDEERREYCRRERQQLKADAQARKEYLASLSPNFKRASTSRQSPKKPKPLAAKPAHSSSSESAVITVVESATGPRNSTKVTKSITSRAGRTSIAPTKHDSPPAESTSPRTAAKRSKTGKTQVTDVDFDHIPDYCPPVNTLDGKTMIISYIHSPREFNDADKKLLHLLHPMEQDLARHERLGAANYLTVKRRIFVDRLYFYHFEKEQQAELDRQGRKDRKFVKNFLKTHAQDACKMDVNKASRLHTAFDSVGWLDRKWFAHFEKPTFDNRLNKHFTAEDYKYGLPGPQKHFRRIAN